MLKDDIEFDLEGHKSTPSFALTTPGLLSRAGDTLVAYTMKHVAMRTQDADVSA